EQPPQRRAALARCTHGRERDGADCEIEIGRGRDDGSVVAAELKDRDRLCGQRRERSLLGWLPHYRVAADESESRIPGPHRHGKLKAEMTPQTPSGCQVSIIRWSARSVAMVWP